MLKLRAALGGWRPSEGEGGHASDPLVLLGATWPEIVGADVAKNSHPAQVERGTLVVATRSSAWSQQLSFMSDQILAAVRARLPNVPLERLRFRIGKLPTPRSFSGSQRVVGKAANPHASSPPPAADAGEALARLRADVEARERAKREVGWKECEGCNALVAPDSGSFCSACVVARWNERERLVSRLLFEAPWLGYSGTARLVEGLTQVEYEHFRHRILSRWWEKLVRAKLSRTLTRDRSERPIASSYVLLKSELPPERITPATVRNLLGDELHDLIYGTEHTER